MNEGIMELPQEEQEKITHSLGGYEEARKYWDTVRKDIHHPRPEQTPQENLFRYLGANVLMDLAGRNHYAKNYGAVYDMNTNEMETRKLQEIFGDCYEQKPSFKVKERLDLLITSLKSYSDKEKTPEILKEIEALQKGEDYFKAAVVEPTGSVT